MSSPESNKPGQHYTTYYVAPQVLPNADGSLINVTSGAVNSRLRVWFYLCEQEGTAQTVTLGCDVGGGGSLGSGEYWLYQYVLPANQILDWTGPFVIKGTDDVRGHDNGGGGNGVAVHFHVEWVF